MGSGELRETSPPIDHTVMYSLTDATTNCEFDLEDIFTMGIYDFTDSYLCLILLTNKTNLKVLTLLSSVQSWEARGQGRYPSIGDWGTAV